MTQLEKYNKVFVDTLEINNEDLENIRIFRRGIR